MGTRDEQGRCANEAGWQAGLTVDDRRMSSSGDGECKNHPVTTEERAEDWQSAHMDTPSGMRERKANDICDR